MSEHGPKPPYKLSQSEREVLLSPEFPIRQLPQFVSDRGLSWFIGDNTTDSNKKSIFIFQPGQTKTASEQNLCEIPCDNLSINAEARPKLERFKKVIDHLIVCCQIIESEIQMQSTKNEKKIFKFGNGNLEKVLYAMYEARNEATGAYEDVHEKALKNAVDENALSTEVLLGEIDDSEGPIEGNWEDIVNIAQKLKINLPPDPFKDALNKHPYR